MKKVYKVRNITIGAGKPKVIVPIVGKTREEIIAKANEIDYKRVDLVEWRVDFYEYVFEMDKVVTLLSELRAIMQETPMIFTFRTSKEGGEKEIDLSTYTLLNKVVAETGYVDIIDIEIFSGDEIVMENIDNIHKAGKLVIASNHDFNKTPSEEELIQRMCKMQEMNADIPKIAMMPQNTQDVITLLSATNRMFTEFADRPIVTMSMSGKGVISRLSGEVFGSAMTFGAVGKVSAPGQMPVEKLNNVLDILSESL
jgi:3-dehydroquinate dehydratase-1